MSSRQDDICDMCIYLQVDNDDNDRKKQQAGVDLKPFFLLYVVSGFVFSTDHSNSNLFARECELENDLSLSINGMQP